MPAQRLRRAGALTVQALCFVAFVAVVRRYGMWSWPTGLALVLAIPFNMITNAVLLTSASSKDGNTTDTK